MPCSASSSAKPLASRSIAVFDVQYGTEPLRIVRAAPDETITTEPRTALSTMRRVIDWVTRKGGPEVHPHDPVPFGNGEVEQQLAWIDPGIVDEDVGRAPTLRNESCKLIDAARRQELGAVKKRGARQVELTAQVAQRVQAPVGQAQLGALTRERPP